MFSSGMWQVLEYKPKLWRHINTLDQIQAWNSLLGWLIYDFAGVMAWFPKREDMINWMI